MKNRKPQKARNFFSEFSSFEFLILDVRSRKGGFFQYYKAKNIAEIFTELLKENHPKMPRKFLPKVIPNKNKKETAIRQQLSVEKFKTEISLQKIRSQKYLERFQTLDAHMIAHFNELRQRHW